MNSNNINSILLVTSKNPENRGFGSGFVIYHFENSSWVVTCTHVIDNVGGEFSIEVNGYPAKIISTSGSKDLDLSLLETLGCLNNPVIKLGTFGRDGSPFTTAGFQVFGNHFSIKQIKGKLVQQNKLISKSLLEQIKVWAITMLGDDVLQDGYSGAPVIDDESGVCVGIINYKQGEGKNGLAISIDELEKILPTTSPTLIEKPINSQNSNHADYLFEKATRLQIMGELQSSLELFQQVKSTNPIYPHIDATISSVEKELSQRYVRHGRVVSDMILETQNSPRQEALQEDQNLQSKIVSFSSGCAIILVVILSYFLWRWSLGW